MKNKRFKLTVVPESIEIEIETDYTLSDDELRIAISEGRYRLTEKGEVVSKEGGVIGHFWRKETKLGEKYEVLLPEINKIECINVDTPKLIDFENDIEISHSTYIVTSLTDKHRRTSVVYVKIVEGRGGKSAFFFDSLNDLTLFNTEVNDGGDDFHKHTIHYCQMENGQYDIVSYLTTKYTWD